jgi:cytidyltransferase-like protein
MNIIVIYPGRFHPFHKGHGSVYKWLKGKFNTVFVATSGKVELPKSPFTFEEKQRMMTTAGVRPSDIVQVKNPYIAKEITDRYPTKKTAVVFAVSEKDMAEDPRFQFKEGRYYRPLPKDLSTLESLDKHGYIVTTPTFPFTVLGHKMQGASQIRDLFAQSDVETQKELVADLFGKFDAAVYKTMAAKLKGDKKSLKQLKEGIDKKAFNPMLDDFVDFACKHLKLDDKPKIILKAAKDQDSSFGGYFPGTKELQVVTKNRHPMDVFRTVAHELIHHKQNIEGRIKDAATEGATGSDIENEANSKAGIIMRDFARANPSAFALSGLTEGYKAIFIVGGSGSGKDYILKRTMSDLFMEEVSLDNLFGRMVRSDLAPSNMIINGPADDYARIVEAKNMVESAGYETFMLFVNTTNEVSRQRNEARAGKSRVVQESIRQKKWENTQQNMKAFQDLWTDRFHIFENNADVRTTDTLIREEFDLGLLGVQKTIQSFMGINEAFEKYMINPANREEGTTSLRDIYAKVTPGQGRVEEKAQMKKVKVVLKKKRKMEEDGGTPQGGRRVGNGGLGPMAMAESVAAWAANPKTIERFEAKYGDQAQAKLEEAVKALQETGLGRPCNRPKTISQLRESKKR